MDSGKVGSFENLALRSRYMMLMVLTPGVSTIGTFGFWPGARCNLCDFISGLGLRVSVGATRGLLVS